MMGILDVPLIIFYCLFAPVANAADGGPQTPPAELRDRHPTAAGDVNLFDAKGRRLGYAIQRSDGSIDVFQPDGSRLGWVSIDR